MAGPGAEFPRLCLLLCLASALGHAADLAPTATQPLVRHERLPKRDIQRYRSYKDVNVLPFQVPEGVRFAVFNFTASESVAYAVVSRCPPRNVTVYLKFGSFPVVSPDGSKFPDFHADARVTQYHEEFESDGTATQINVTNPRAGEWYAVAFLSYTDPNGDKILQQGLSASCMALLEATLEVQREARTSLLASGVPLRDKLTADGEAGARSYRLYVPEGAAYLRLNLTLDPCKGRCPSVTLSTRPHALPDSENGSTPLQCLPEPLTQGEPCIFTLIPEEDAWYYVTIFATTTDKKLLLSKLNVPLSVSFTLEVTVEMDDQVLLQLSGNVSEAEPAETECGGGAECWSRAPLMRQSYIALFMFNYVRVPGVGRPAGLQQALNLSTAATTLLSFPLFPVKDIGGTLTFELRLDRTPALDNATASAGSGLNVTVVACLSFSGRQTPKFPPACADVNTGREFPASVQVNTSSASAHMGKLHVPFPEPGRWYLSMRPFCFSGAGNGSGGPGPDPNPEPDPPPMPREGDCGDLNVTQVSFVLDSEMCGADSCGRWGHCNNYLSGGVIFSTCVCNHGYRGWGCTDDSRTDQLSDLRLAALLLTLSNLPFLGAAAVAARRRYWTEALVYCCTLFFSTFYHACEAGEDVYSYCLMKLPVLQFCDFYSAILALWVTLVAMADLPVTLKSLAHMAGAVGIALGTEYDRTSLSVFLVPALLGLAVVGVRWGLRCRSHKACYPHKAYWKFFLPPGVALVLIGIVCYSFLQTRNNYKYVHSAWHALMAVAVMLVLPARRYTALDPNESDESVDSATPVWRRRRGLCSCKRE